MLKKLLSFLIIPTIIFGTNLQSNAIEKGGRVFIYTEYKPKNLIPVFEYNNDIKNIYNLIYSGLLGIDENFDYYPDIAISIPSIENRGVEFNNEKMIVTYKIRDLAFWHDGNPVSSEDIKFTWQVYTNPNIKKDKNIDLEGYNLIEKVETPDNKTVKLFFKKEYSNYKSLFKYILPKHISLKNNDIVGTGPFQLIEFKNNHLVLDANKLFYRNKPYLDQIIINYSKNINNNLIKKENYIIDSDLKKNNNNNNIVKVPENNIEELVFNTKNLPMNNLDLRKSIAYIINREYLIKGNNNIIPAWSDIHPNSQIYDNYLKNKYFYDFKKSNYYLDKASYIINNKGLRENKNGEELKLKILAINNNLSLKIADYLKSNLKNLGIDSSIKEINEKDIQKNDYDILIYKRPIVTNPNERKLYLSKNSISNGENYSKYSNQVLESIFNNTSKINDNNNQKIINNILAEEIPTIPLFIYTKNISISKNINNFKPNLYLGNTWNSFEWWIN